MKEAKRKQIETQLRRLIALDERKRKEFDTKPLRTPRSIRVIRRRKGSPNRHIFDTSRYTETAELETA